VGPGGGSGRGSRVAGARAGAGRTALRAVFSPGNRKILFVLAGLLVLIFVFVGSNVAANHAPRPHGLPLGVVGPPRAVAAVAGDLDRKAPGAFAVRAYGSLAAARTAILHRSVYGALEPAPPPVLLVADAASSFVAALLQQTFQAVAHAQGQRLTIYDVAPLPPSDSTGATSFSATISLVIAGILGTSMIYLVTRDRTLAVRLTALVILAAGAGLLTALVTNVVVGAFSGHFLAIWGVATLFVLAMVMPITAFQVLFGLPGTAVGLVVFVVVGDPSSGGSTAPQLLPNPWRDISQGLPPGAAVTAMRDVVYFQGYGSTRGLITLGVYAVLGAIAAVIVNGVRRPSRPPARDENARAHQELGAFSASLLNGPGGPSLRQERGHSLRGLGRAEQPGRQFGEDVRPAVEPGEYRRGQQRLGLAQPLRRRRAQRVQHRDGARVDVVHGLGDQADPGGGRRVERLPGQVVPARGSRVHPR
jgi:hypothetical protein